MSEATAMLLVRIAGLYTGLGVLFAIPFVLRGAARLDPSAAAGTRGFRLMILPGCIALWPYLAWRWVRAAAGRPPPVECNAHRRAAGGGP